MAALATHTRIFNTRSCSCARAGAHICRWARTHARTHKDDSKDSQSLRIDHTKGRKRDTPGCLTSLVPSSRPAPNGSPGSWTTRGYGFQAPSPTGACFPLLTRVEEGFRLRETLTVATGQQGSTYQPPEHVRTRTQLASQPSHAHTQSPSTTRL